MDNNQTMVTTLLIDQSHDAPLVAEHRMRNELLNESIAAVLGCQKVGGLHGLLPGGDVLWIDLRDTPPGAVNLDELEPMMVGGRQLITGAVYKDGDGYHVRPPLLTVELLVMAHMATYLRSKLH